MEKERRHFLLTVSTIGTSHEISDRPACMSAGLKELIAEYNGNGCKISYFINHQLGEGKKPTGSITGKMTVTGNHLGMYPGLIKSIEHIGYQVRPL